MYAYMKLYIVKFTSKQTASCNVNEAGSYVRGKF